MRLGTVATVICKSEYSMAKVQVSFQKSLLKKRPVLTIEDSVLHSDDYFESRLLRNGVFTDEHISGKYFTYRSVQIFKILFEDFILRNLILCTRSYCTGSGFIAQPSWLLHFVPTKMVVRKMFCTTLVDLSRKFFREFSLLIEDQNFRRYRFVRILSIQ